MSSQRGKFARWLRRIGVAFLVLTLLALAPVIWVETACYANKNVTDGFQSRLPRSAQREEVNSYLTYPEWSIVHAYQDLAFVSKAGSPSDFSYLASVGGYWRNLCNIVGYASARSKVSGEYRAMLHIIGVSFSAEMVVKGVYEKTIGRFTAWLRGKDKTPEDQFAQKVADEYAAFLHQTPWYEFPFGRRLGQFWSTTPFGMSHFIRRVERRVALTLEYGGKAIYAQVIGALAGAVPAPLSIQSIVVGADPAIVPGVKIIKRLSQGEVVIETPRYAKFTVIMGELARAGIVFREIAGNDDIMVALLVPRQSTFQHPGMSELMSVAVAFKPGWRRLMVNVKVGSLADLLEKSRAQGVQVEHVYDY